MLSFHIQRAIMEHSFIIRDTRKFDLSALFNASLPFHIHRAKPFTVKAHTKIWPQCFIVVFKDLFYIITWVTIGSVERNNIALLCSEILAAIFVDEICLDAVKKTNTYSSTK